MCMSRGETFPNIYGQLDVMGLAFQLYDAPSWFSVCPGLIFANLTLVGHKLINHSSLI